MKRLLLLLWLVPALCGLRLTAQSDATLIPFQGRLTDQTGQAVTNGVFSVVFQLYNAPVGGDILWSERHERVGVLNGMVNVFLGSISALDGIDFSTTRHLGITVDIDQNPNTPDVEMVPRQMIIPAFWAKNSDKMSGYNWSPLFGVNSPMGTISGGKITSGTIGGAQLAAGAVQSQHLGVGSVTSDKLSAEVAGGLGGGGRNASGLNYITTGSGDATSGWKLYKDPASTSPTTSTGSITNIGISWTRGTNGLLRQGNEFLLTVNGGASRQGEGVSTDFTIDPADQTRMLTVTYDGLAVSGGFQAGDLRLYIIGAPGTTNSTVIEPVGTVVSGAVQGMPFQGRASFQALKGITQYRLCVHVASPSTAGYVVAFDSFSVGPQGTQTGTPITDWEDKGPITIGATTTPPTKGATRPLDRVLMRRVGDSAELLYEYMQTAAGTAGSGNYLFSLPIGLSFDLAKVASGGFGNLGSGTASAVGFGSVSSGGTSGVYGFNANVVVIPYDATRFYVFITSMQKGDGAGDGAVNHPISESFLGLRDLPYGFRFSLRAPIQGWGSSVRMSSDAGDGRVVAFSYGLTTTYSYTAGSNALFDTRRIDTHGSFVVGDAASGSAYIVPVAGIYKIKVAFDFNGSVAGYATSIVKNGSTYGEPGWIIDAQSNEWLIPCALGDALTVRIVMSGQPSPPYINFSGYRLSESSAPSASETVAARYTTTNAQAVIKGTLVNFESQVFDSHGAVTTGPAWRFTAPMSGIYEVRASFLTAGTTSAQYFYYTIGKNGIDQNITIAWHIKESNVEARQNANGSALIKLAFGDYIDIRATASRTITTLSGDGGINYVEVIRVGN